MNPNEILSAVGEAGAQGVNQTVLFAGVGIGAGQIGLTNTLAQMRRDGSVVSRREVRDGERVTIYYTPENAPALPVGGGE